MYRIKEELISEILEEQIIGGGVSSVCQYLCRCVSKYQRKLLGIFLQPGQWGSSTD